MIKTHNQYLDFQIKIIKWHKQLQIKLIFKILDQKYNKISNFRLLYKFKIAPLLLIIL